MLKSLDKVFNIKIQNIHSKLIRAVHCSKGLDKTKFLGTVWLYQGNLDCRQGKVREMSGNFVLSSLYEPWYWSRVGRSTIWAGS